MQIMNENVTYLYKMKHHGDGSVFMSLFNGDDVLAIKFGVNYKDYMLKIDTSKIFHVCNDNLVIGFVSGADIEIVLENYSVMKWMDIRDARDLWDVLVNSGFKERE